MTHLFQQFHKVARLRPAQWRDLARAAFELAIANRRMRSYPAGELLGTARKAMPTVGSLSDRQRKLVTRVAFAIPRAGARVPWRGDCLVQALAAQRWLARAGVRADISIGVRRDPAFEAHAWLKVADVVVTGGDIAGFAPLLDPGARM